MTPQSVTGETTDGIPTIVVSPPTILKVSPNIINYATPPPRAQRSSILYIYHRSKPKSKSERSSDRKSLPPSIWHALPAVKAMSVSRISYLLIVLTLPADVLYS